MRRSSLLLAAMALLSAWSRNPAISHWPASAQPPFGSVAGDEWDASEQSDLAALRSATAPLQDLEAATTAGWSAQITPCLSDSAGGLGIHYGNPAFLDGSVRVESPQLLLFEPLPNGAKRLVAAEYVVPITTWTSAEPPRLFRRAFKLNAAFGIWTLHVWAWKDNPNGLYADWNPRVNCSHAE